MKNYQKYEKSYFMPPEVTYDWAKKDSVEQPPKWCSVDLRDGNQALIEPMSLDEKLEFFQMLVDIGFKEIEVGFPAASETEYQFMRTLIEKDMIPDDVTVQVLTQAREHIIKRTFEAVKGAPHAVIHLYNSTSVAQREQVFKKDKKEIIFKLHSGMPLSIKDEFLYAELDGRTVKVAKLSKARMLELENLSAKGYRPCGGEVRFVVAWKGESEIEETAVLLPNLHFKKD